MCTQKIVVPCEATVTGKNSICQKIWNSHTLSSWLEKAILASENPRGVTLSAAKHRFCSYSMPLARFILHLPVFIDTINKIAAGGTSWATQWLEEIQVSELILLSMCADLAQNAIELTRFFDKEDMDVAEMNEKVYYFVQQMEVICLLMLFAFASVEVSNWELFAAVANRFHSTVS